MKIKSKRRRKLIVSVPGKSASQRAAKGATAAANRRSPRRSSGRPAVTRRHGSRKTGRWQRNGTLSVIISARNEQKTLLPLLKQVSRLQPMEIIVVLNGCIDNSFRQARLSKEAMIIHLPDSAGHDVGRAIGAKLSRGDILLFLDGDMVIPAPQLAPFPAAVDKGVDVALNDLNSLLPPFRLSDDVTRSKMFLNLALGRGDLGVSSMTAVPHALSRHALEKIGFQELMVPPKAQALSILGGLRVEQVGTVDVIKHNRLRRTNIGTGNAVEQLITGDHAEALHEVLSRRDPGSLVPEEVFWEKRRQMAIWRNGL
ncbi:glycosyltransferase family 2 protein [Paenibacillus agri]|uniref:4,4'-diaponeurosporenoate glycosyltransferase n=1 Tax=Paenibacillus agri TaxID=2744309 RepID=A0A850EIV3_9BACL|nr:glycosyltransferase family A protein [Paenibacillus agri]NUU60306.1 glycosyltransferase [Paenibacillus agri]